MTHRASGPPWGFPKTRRMGYTTQTNQPTNQTKPNYYGAAGVTPVGSQALGGGYTTQTKPNYNY